MEGRKHISFENEHHFLPKSRIKQQWFTVKSECFPQKNFLKYLFQFKSTGKNFGITPSYYQDIISPNLPFFEDWALERLSKGRVKVKNIQLTLHMEIQIILKAHMLLSEKLKYRNTSTQKEV